MKKSSELLLGALFLLAGAILPAMAWQGSSVTGDQDSGYHIRVVSRSTEAVDYRHNASTKINLRGTDLMAGAKGEAKVDAKGGRIQVEANLEHVTEPSQFGLAYLTYVLWAITPEGQPHNLGELLVKDEKVHLNVTTDLQVFALIVTAEPYYAVTQPSDLVVAQNEVRHDTKGFVQSVDVKYELIPRDVYAAQVQPVPNPMFGIDRTLPLDLLEARNAVRIAKDAQADKYAADTYQKAMDELSRAEDYYRRKQGAGPIGTTARAAAQSAEEARLISIKRQQDEEAERERQASDQRTADAQAAADEQRQQAAAQQAAAAQAQAQAAQAQAQAAQAQAQAQQADQARRQAEQARDQAEQAQAQTRARLLQQLNQVLQTRDTARGLIVNMPDVLFDTGKSDLKPAARERLAKVAGILLAYPDIKLEIDGYTDSTGSADFNQELSNQRADAVRGYLGQQGVGGTAMTTQGYGMADPIASNDTAEGRRQNRRVELVVSGQSIGNMVGQTGDLQNNGQGYGQNSSPSNGNVGASQNSMPGQNGVPGQPAPAQTQPAQVSPQP